MFDIIGKRYYYFALSLLFIIPGLVAMVYSTIQFGTPVRLSIDFTGGALLELQFEKPVLPEKVHLAFVDEGFFDTMVQTTDERTVVVRSKPLTMEVKDRIEEKLEEDFGSITELRFDSVGPAIGHEVTSAAALAVIAASLLILFFIIFAFRKVPNAFRYGVCAISAMVHNVLIAGGLFSLAGIFLGWEADSLFLTALLTVIGFSVQDAIVVFDRIRENTPKRRGEPFETIVNRSLLETLHRSLATQLNAIFVLIAILLFGGATIKQFVIILIIGFIGGTYSSICNAVPLLVVWEKGEIGAFFQRLFGKKEARAPA